jgi:hypothetical protein
MFKAREEEISLEHNCFVSVLCRDSIVGFIFVSVMGMLRNTAPFGRIDSETWFQNVLLQAITSLEKRLGWKEVKNSEVVTFWQHYHAVSVFRSRWEPQRPRVAGPRRAFS